MCVCVCVCVCKLERFTINSQFWVNSATTTLLQGWIWH